MHISECQMSKLIVLKRALGLVGQHRKLTPRNVVFITGCDSGLGYSLAVYCHSQMNMTVISACHSINSEGSRLLQALNHSKRMITIELDLLRQSTIDNAHQRLIDLLQENTGIGYEFTALINNAGVMCFGEFEWQTTEQFETQINVNLIGTLRLTKKLLPLIRQHCGRIINVTSHCGLQALPGLGPYAASKAALRFWNDSLRIEMHQYGVKVVNIVPGSFVLCSNISARQQEHAREMYKCFSIEQQNFYGVYFKQFNDYLQVVSGFKNPNMLNDKELLLKFEDALTSNAPKALYIHETWRYKFYRILFRYCPTFIVDWLTVKFCAIPTYHQVLSSASSKLKGKKI